jgi:hypothetical protein
MARAKQRTAPDAKHPDQTHPQQAASAAKRSTDADEVAADLPKREVLSLLDPQLRSGALTAAPSPTQTATDGVQPAVQPTSDATQTMTQTASDGTQLANQLAGNASNLNAGQPYSPSATSVAES